MLRKKALFVSVMILTLLAINFLNPTNNLVNLGNAHYEKLFYLDLIHARGAWAITNGSRDVTVAVIDSGIDFTHSELTNAAWVNEDEIADNGLDDDGNGYIDDINGWDFVFNDSTPGPYPEEIHWHGTFIAGLINSPLNGLGPVGVAPNVTVMDVRVLDAANYAGTTYEGLGDAIRYAVDNGADVINLSLHYYDANDTYYDDILYAVSQNVAVVSITGNTYPPTGGQEYKSYPGGYDEVITVGATDSYGDSISDYSNYGEWTEIVAPVGNSTESRHIYSTVPFYTYGTSYGWGTGTSFACPQVSAVIALMKSLNSSMPISEMRTILQETATDLGDPGKDIYFGYGLLNASAALEAMFPPPEEPTDPSTNGTSLSFLPIITSFIFLTTVILIYKRKK